MHFLPNLFIPLLLFQNRHCNCTHLSGIIAWWLQCNGLSHVIFSSVNWVNLSLEKGENLYGNIREHLKLFQWRLAIASQILSTLCSHMKKMHSFDSDVRQSILICYRTKESWDTFISIWQCYLNFNRLLLPRKVRNEYQWMKMGILVTNYWVTNYHKTWQLKGTNMNFLAESLTFWNLGVADFGHSGSGSLRKLSSICQAVSWGWVSRDLIGAGDLLPSSLLKPLAGSCSSLACGCHYCVP